MQRVEDVRLGPAVKVHGLAMAREVLAAASGRAVTLLSGEGAASYAGVGWWRALVAAGLSGAPDAARVTNVLDCGGAPGRALEALRAGQLVLVLRAEPRVWADVAARAAGLNATLLAEAPPALDMAQPGAQRRLAAWLAAAGDRRHGIG